MATPKRIDVDRTGDRLVVRFPYDEAVVAQLRDVRGCFFSAADSAWFAPVEQLESLIVALRGRGFCMSPAVQARLGQPVAEVIKRHQARSAEQDRRGWLTPSELLAGVNKALRRHFDARVSIAGEISGLKRRNPPLYFALLERSPDRGEQIAALPVVVFPDAARRIDKTIAENDLGLELCDGQQVCLVGRVEVHDKSGRLQLRVFDLDPSHTVGMRVMRQRAVLDALTREGIRDDNRSKALPAVPLRVALIGSGESDGLRDFVKELGRSGLAFSVRIYDVRVQGASAEPQIAAALAQVARSAARTDVTVIVRGGGSRADLAWFDSEVLGRAVCLHPRPVVVGIGHDRDQSVLDHVARSCKTPTAAAVVLVDRVRSALIRLERLSHALVRSAHRRLVSEREGLQRREQRLRRAGPRALRSVGSRTDSRAARLHVAAGFAMRGARRHTSALARRVEVAGLRALAEKRQRLDRCAAALEPARVRRMLPPQRSRLDGLQRRLRRTVERVLIREQDRLDAMSALHRALSPDRVLQRGFAIVRRADGVERNVVTSVEGVEGPTDVIVTLRDGALSGTLSPADPDVDEPTAGHQE